MMALRCINLGETPLKASVWNERLSTLPPTKSLLQTKYTPLWQRDSLTAAVPSRQDNASCPGLKNGLVAVWERWPRVSVHLASKSQSDLWNELDKQVLLKAPPRDFRTNVILPDTTAHLQSPCGVHAFTDHCFGDTTETYTISRGRVESYGRDLTSDVK